MLAGEDFGWRHQGRLRAGFHRQQHGVQRHHGLAAADIALQQPQHALVRAHIASDFGIGLPLRIGQRPGQQLFQLIAQTPVTLHRAAGQPLQAPPHQQKRKLIG